MHYRIADFHFQYPRINIWKLVLFNINCGRVYSTQRSNWFTLSKEEVSKFHLALCLFSFFLFEYVKQRSFIKYNMSISYKSASSFFFSTFQLTSELPIISCCRHVSQVFDWKNKTRFKSCDLKSNEIWN